MCIRDRLHGDPERGPSQADLALLRGQSRHTRGVGQEEDHERQGGRVAMPPGGDLEVVADCLRQAPFVGGTRVVERRIGLRPRRDDSLLGDEPGHPVSHTHLDVYKRQVINSYAWVFYIFGAFLIWTAWKLAREGESDDDEYEENAFLQFVERRFPATSSFHGTKLFVHEGAKRLVTPMFIVIMALGTTDLLFALDSIPAIYGLTKEPYLVLTANIFALMGLRQLYFLIGGLLKRLVYLSIGLAVLLSLIHI